MKFLRCFGVVAAISIFASLSVTGQETETRVIDEVVAVINDGVITLSGIRREMKAAVNEKVQGGMSLEDAQKQVEETRGQMIADLINQELLVQKAKELGIEQEVDAAINARQLDIMRQYNMRTVEELYETMRSQGVDPDEIKALWKRQIIRERVLQREVQGKLYWQFTAKQIKDYFEKNKAKFTQPETISLSEIFMSFAGREPATVREKAKEIITRARNGEDFGTLVLEVSDRPDAATTKGKVEKLALSELDPKYLPFIKDLKIGGITDSIELDDTGVSIIKIDDRTAASNESHFDERAIRLAMMKEKLPAAEKAFFSDLRNESFIKIGESYRPIVSPILFAEERKEKTSN